MIFTAGQIEQITGVLDRYLLTFAAHHIGINVLSAVEVAQLQSAGVNTAAITAATSNVSQAFKLGLLSNALGDAATKNMTYDQFLNYLSTGKMFKLNALESSALQTLQYQALKDTKRMGAKIKDQIADRLVHANKTANTVTHSKLVTDAAKKSILERKGIASVISDIGHAEPNWNRDFGRIADFVLHSAFDEGRANGILTRTGPQALVYKDVYAGACKHCIEKYLKGGIMSEPKVFQLSVLQANGTNVGKKVADWLPVIGPLHPWCRCTLMSVPNGLTLVDLANGKWVWQNGDFVRDPKKWERKVQRKSKVRVTVNNKTTEI